ncbi:Aldo/keto reductase [Trametes coccinea BRFM310]|uniref:Aldo/keto reductase n=1 Tax=Trametes coccinea (strain BRFM310) TaxID=1353009 RepID=A0A1Y2IYT8_TRAC3|nr:Aldo/keto reductase [Trametes coccinea BRFM310]
MQNTYVCPRFKLNNGNIMPAIGAGCWLGSAGEDEHVTAMVETALDLGYRHIDTVGFNSSSGNEESVGRALKKTSIPRVDIFLTTKLDQKDHSRVLEALDTSLAKLGVEYVDLYLMHWPMAFNESDRTLQPGESPTFVETWKEMEKLLATGKAKAIGVSNFSVQTLSVLLAQATVVPAVNQVELHPCLPQHDLLAFCAERGILLTAYTPLGKHKFADDPTIRSIAEAHGPETTLAQVLLSWGVQRGTAVIPKSLDPSRLRQNLRLIELNASEMDALNSLHKKPGMHRSMCSFHSQTLGGSCFGWTYKQLGWEMIAGGIHL